MHLPNTQAKLLPNDALSVVAGIDREKKNLPTFCLDVFLVVCWSMPVRNFGEATSRGLAAHRQKSWQVISWYGVAHIGSPTSHSGCLYGRISYVR